MATIGSIKYDVILRTKDGSHEQVVGELEIPITIETRQGHGTIRGERGPEMVVANLALGGDAKRPKRGA